MSSMHNMPITQQLIILEERELRRRTFQICDLCMGRKGSQLIIFIPCEFSFSLWNHFLQKYGLAWCIQGSISSLLDAWRTTPFHKCWLLQWSRSFHHSWSIWKAWNHHIFRGASSSLDAILSTVVFKIAKRIVIRKEFENVTLDYVIHKWEA